MQRQEQILYMQTRIMQMAMDRWNKSISQVAKIFEEYGLAQIIEDDFELFHVEGDEAVFADLMDYFIAKGGAPNGTVDA